MVKTISLCTIFQILLNMLERLLYLNSEFIKLRKEKKENLYIILLNYNERKETYLAIVIFSSETCMCHHIINAR